MDENYIASCNPVGEGVVSIWDRRSGSRTSSVTPEGAMATAALEYRDLLTPRSSIWGLRFSRTRRGCLGMLTSTGVFRCYDLAKEYVLEEDRANIDHTLGINATNTYPEPIYTKNTRHFRSPFSPQEQTHDGSQRVSAFDFLNLGTSNEAHAVTILADKSVCLYRFTSTTSPMDISSKSALIRGGRVNDEMDFKIIQGPFASETKSRDIVRDIQSRTISPTILNQSTSQPESSDGQSCRDMLNPPEKHYSSRELRQLLLSPGTTGVPLTVQDALAWLSIPRLRCQEGYLLDSTENKAIIGDNDRGLQEFWDWIRRKLIPQLDPLFIY